MQLPQFSLGKSKFLGLVKKKHSNKDNQINKKVITQKPQNYYDSVLNSLFHKKFTPTNNRRIKTQNEEKDANIQRQHNKSQLTKNNSQLNQKTEKNYLKQTVKSKSLKFEYFYKNIKQKQKEKVKVVQNQLQKYQIKFQPTSTLNLNHQMLQSMKRYIRKIQKTKTSPFKNSINNAKQKIVQNPNQKSNDNESMIDLKTVYKKKKSFIQQFLRVKQMKKVSKSTLFLVKRGKSKSLASTVEMKANNKIEIKKVCELENILCPKQAVLASPEKEKTNKIIICNKNNIQNVFIDKRFVKMTSNFNLILNAFKCRFCGISQQYQLQKDMKKAKKFKYFIGYGNNRNLIRSIMKKRWWWIQVQQLCQADFIWTQLKVNSILDRMEQQKVQFLEQRQSIVSQPQLRKQLKEQTQKYAYSREYNGYENLNQFKTSNIYLNQVIIQNQLNQHSHLSKNSQPQAQFSSNLLKNQPSSLTPKLAQNKNNYMSISTDIAKSCNTLNKTQSLINHSSNKTPKKKVISNKFIQLTSNHKKIFHSTESLTFAQPSNNKKQDFCLIKQPSIIHNHFKNNYMFGNKNALFNNLRQYFQFYKDEQIWNIIPKTYYLQKNNKKAIQQFKDKQFPSSIPQSKSKKWENLWIVKPAQNSNRGQGISVHNSFENIRRQMTRNRTVQKFIVQKYLTNLFLYQKRKFDIRTYVLMVTLGNTTKYFWYSQGYLRTSSQIFNLQDVQNIFIHLTNDAIQCDGQNYGKFQQGNKISYSQFQRYLDSTYPDLKYSVENLNSKMKKIASQAVKVIYPKIKTSKVNYSFELFGLDFLIDRNYQPWLLQINTNPCLQLGCPVLQRLIPRMLQNMFRICLDPVFQPLDASSRASSYFVYDNVFQINRFELIFDSNYDNDSQWMKQCNQSKQQVYADDNDIFDDDGEELEMETM